MDALNSYLVKGVRVLRLSGSDVERAEAHGAAIRALSKQERATLATRPLAVKNQNLLERALKSASLLPEFAKTTASNAVVKAYEEVILRHHRYLDERYTSRLEAFARHSHLSPRELIFALYQPDFLMVLAALTSEKKQAHFLSGMPGCSSAIVRTGKEGGLTLLRNLDYPAAGHWEKWPTVFFHEPSETRFQKYVSVGSLGIHLAGLSGVNESGIGFSLHAHFSKKFSMRGTPIFFLGQEILESARSIDEAIFLCKSFRTIGSWAINLASEKENRAVTVELSDGKIFIREMDPEASAHAHANGFQCEEFKEQELHFNGSFFQDVESRKSSLEKNLEKPHPESDDAFLSMREALRSLASHEDHTSGEIRIFGNTVSVVTTIQSLAIDLRNQEILLSIRDETPTPLGPFLAIPTDWSKLPIAFAHPILHDLSHAYSAPFMQALHEYYRAYCEWHVLSGKPTSVLEHLIRGTEALPNDPHLLMQRGYFELLVSRQEGHFRAALDCFQRALKEKMSDHHVLVAHYFVGVCLDLLGDRDMAITEYSWVADSPKVDPKLLKKALKRTHSPYQYSYCQKLVPDLQFVEPLEYV